MESNESINYLQYKTTAINKIICSDTGVNSDPYSQNNRLTYFLIAMTIALGLLQTLVGALPSDTGFIEQNQVAVILGIIWLAIILFFSIRNPISILSMLAFFFCFTSWRPIDLPIGSLQVTHLLAIAISFPIILRIIIKQEAINDTRFLKLLLILLFILTVSIIQIAVLDFKNYEDLAIIRSGRATPMIRSITAIIALMIGMLAFLSVTQLINNEKMLNKILNFWILGCVFASIIGIYIFCANIFSFLPRIPEQVLLGSRGLGITSRDIRALTEGGDIMFRISSVAVEPRHLCYLLTQCLSFLISRVIIDKKYRNKFYLLSLFIITITFGLTASRSTYALILIIFLIAVYTVQKTGKLSMTEIIRFLSLIMCFSLIMGLVTYLITNLNFFEFIQMQMDSLFMRATAGSGVAYAIDGNKTAWQMFLDNPVIGKGWGSFIYYTEIYRYEFARAAVPTNLYLLLMSETGILGLGSFMSILFYGIYCILKRGNTESISTRYPLYSTLITTCAIFLVWDAVSYTTFWFILGLISSASSNLSD